MAFLSLTDKWFGCNAPPSIIKQMTKRDTEFMKKPRDPEAQIEDTKQHDQTFINSRCLLRTNMADFWGSLQWSCMGDGDIFAINSQ